jgi:hypothetical protein
MLIDGRQQFEREPKAIASKRNRMTDAHPLALKSVTVAAEQDLNR